MCIRDSTTTGLLSGKPYSGYGYAEGAVSAVTISADRFRGLMTADAGFQDLVFRGCANRVGELTDVIDELLLHRTDLKLARWLARQVDDEIHQTQQDIARELGTAREVISRALKAFERSSWIAIGRGSVKLINRAALRSHGDSGSM